MPSRNIDRWLWLAGIIVGVDQISKWLVLAWLQPGDSIYFAPFFNWVLTFNPAPGAFTQLGDDLVKLWRSEINSGLSSTDAACGTILLANADGVQVACGAGVLRLTELQRAGGKRLSAAEFLRGHDIKAGMMFETAAP